jgi:hypothetical protein
LEFELRGGAWRPAALRDVTGFFGSNWFRVEYWPAHEPWYDGAIWGNLFVLPVAFVLCTLFWPAFRRAVLRAFRRETSEIHRKLDWMIEKHPDIPPLPPK